MQKLRLAAAAMVSSRSMRQMKPGTNPFPAIFCSPSRSWLAKEQNGRLGTSRRRGWSDHCGRPCTGYPGDRSGWKIDGRPVFLQGFR